MRPYFSSSDGDFVLYAGDSREVVPRLPHGRIGMVFADPPYFLANGGFSVQAGRRVSVNKGDWDKSHGAEADGEFNRQWIGACRERLADDGTIWVCGSFHNIFSIAEAGGQRMTALRPHDSQESHFIKCENRESP